MSARAAYETPTLAHPLTGEVIRDDDLPAIKEAVEDLEQYLDRPEVKRMWEMRRKLSARLVALEPDVVLPGWLAQTETQRKVQRCPRCREILPQDSEPEPVPQPEPQVGADPARGADGLDSAGPESSGAGDFSGGHGVQGDPATHRDTPAVVGRSVAHGETPAAEQTTLLPQGQRTAEQEAALGVDIFGAPADPEPESPPQGVSPAQDPGEVASDGGAASSPSPAVPGEIVDPIVEQAGDVVIPKGNRAGKTVAQVALEEPEWCLWYIDNGLTESLKSAIVTYMFAVHPELMKEKT